MNNFFLDPPITGVTINNVALAPAFRQLLLFCMAVIFVIGVVVWATRRQSFFTALRKSLVVTFFAGGLLYAFQSDLGWGRWLIKDYHSFSGKTTDEKLLTLEGPLYEFARRSRMNLRGDYILLNDDSGNYVTRRYEYFLLPLRKRDVAPYIVVLADPDAKYDPASRIFRRGDLVVHDAQPVLFYRGAYILRKP